MIEVLGMTPEMGLVRGLQLGEGLSLHDRAVRPVAVLISCRDRLGITVR
jgi:hypothetical protein